MNSEDKRNEYKELLEENPDTVVVPPSEGDENAGSEKQQLHLLTHALSEHSFFIFGEGETGQHGGEAPADVDGKVQEIMEATEDIRPDKPRIIDIRRWGGLALAATLLIIVGIGLLHLWPSTLPGRGQRIAYLTSTGSMVSVRRDGRPVAAEEAMTVLKVGDKVEVGEKGGATIVYSEKVYQLTGKKHVLLTKTGLRGADDGEQVTPLALDGRRLAMAPRKLLSPVEMPPTTRAVSPEVTIMTPRGKVLSRTPPIIWTGNEDARRWIAIVAVQKNGQTVQVREPIRARGGKVSWEKTGWEPLERGGTYAVYLRDSDQKRLLSGRSQTFSVVGQQEAQPLQANLKRIDQMVSDTTTRRFLRANMLMSRPWECYSEARVDAVALYKQAPESVPVLKLLQRCYGQLGMKQGVKLLQKKLDKLKADRPDQRTNQ